VKTTVSRPALGPTQPSIQWLPGAISLGGGGVMRLGREAHQSPPSSDEVKYAWSCTSTPPILHGVVVVKHRDTFTLPLLLPTNYEARH
jgi:hypothetical protein